MGINVRLEIGNKQLMTVGKLPTGKIARKFQQDPVFGHTVDGSELR